jgi:hypothetical protein
MITIMGPFGGILELGMPSPLEDIIRVLREFYTF